MTLEEFQKEFKILLKKGDIAIEQGDIIGLAEDSEVVLLGDIFTLEETAEYLRENPNPKDW